MLVGERIDKMEYLLILNSVCVSLNFWWVKWGLFFMLIVRNDVGKNFDGWL